MTWEVGDLAVCVDDEWEEISSGVWPTNHPRKNAVYRVADAGVYGNIHWLSFTEFGESAWDVIKFRKVLPDKHEACEEEFKLLVYRVPCSVP